MKEWQFNVLFFVGVGGAVVLLFGPSFGLDIASSPTAVAGIGAILTYVLSQRKVLTKKKRNERNDDAAEDDDETVERKPKDEIYGPSIKRKNESREEE